MQGTPKYVIPDFIGSFGARHFFLLCLCAVFPMALTGDSASAVRVVQGDVFMSWQINNSDSSQDRYVVNPDDSTVIFFPSSSVTGTVAAAFTNRVRDVGSVALGNVSFSLINLTKADAGRYFYRIFPDTDVGGQVLVIAGKPDNVLVMAMSSPDENKQYKLRCSAQSTSVPLGMGLTMHYQWKRENGQNITVSDRYSFSSDQSNLIINPLKKEDDGIFVCEAWEHVGAVSKSATFSLTVILEQGKKQNCELELRVCLVLGFCIPFVIIGIVFVIFKCTVHIRAYYRGLVLGISLGVTFQVDWIIIVILIVTGTTSCTTELGLGHVLVFGVICLIVCIIAVIFRFCPFSFLEDNPKRVEEGKGILIGFLFASVIGIVVVYLICTKDEDNQPEPDVSSVQTYVGSEANFSFMLTVDSNESSVFIKNKSGGIVMIARGTVGRSDDPFYKDRVNFTGNTNKKLISFTLRNVTLEDAGIYIAVLTNPEKTIGSQMLIVKDVSSVQTYVGSDANFSFMLTEDPNASPVLIKTESGGVVMSACGIVGKSTDPLYKSRVNFTGNTNKKLISFILRNVTLEDAGIYIAVQSDANRTIGSQMLIVKGTNDEDNPQETDGKISEQVPLKPIDTKGKTKNPGSSSAVSREQVEVQMEIKGVKSDEERPPAVHLGTQNKVDPNTISKQTNGRQQPLPPANTGFEDTSKFRPQPQPPQNGEIKDRNLRGISATIDDTPGLANETPLPKKLPPIHLKQETVQEKGASEKPKKKRKNKKKKDQMNEETPEDKNGETV